MTEKLEPLPPLPEGVPLIDGIGIVDGLPRVIDREEYNRRREERERDRKFFDAHRKEFLKQYPDRYVAVFREQVVAVADTHIDICDKLDNLGIRRTYPEVHRIYTKPVHWVI